jgi:hemolysin III
VGLKEPFNSISHMVGGGLAVAGLAVLVILAQGAVQIVAATLYGLGLIAVFTMSTLYHSIPGRPAVEKWLERLDHVAIYLLIAGTYTPVCLVLLGGAWGWSLFGTVWGIALVGIVLKLTVPLGPQWLHITGYIALGWVALIAAPVLFPILTTQGLALLVAGGVIYTLGALLYVWDKPRLIGPLGAHEVWHLMVIAGAVSHFAFVLLWVY